MKRRIFRPAAATRQPRALQLQAKREAAARKGDDARKLYGLTAWRVLRKQHLRQHPFCVECTPPTVGTVVDHKTPHGGDASLFFDPDNLQTMCKRHHDRKTASEDGGFGNTRRSPTPP